MDQPGPAPEEISNAARQVETALALFAARQQELYRPDGEPLYSADEERDRRAALAAPALAIIDSALALADRTAAGAKDRDLRLDPIYTLAGPDAQRAAALAPFIESDAKSAPLDALIRTVRAASRSGDKVTRLLIARYVAQRITMLAAQARRPGANPPKEFPELRGALDELNQVDAPPAPAVSTADLVRSAQQLKLAANQARDQITGAAAQRQTDTNQRVAARF